jgi:16S rRNA C967 or C1407 C5-methylase (RsmB/RsmF family)/NOL1/NOP2/fmu family ribosome biogenesis protein
MHILAGVNIPALFLETIKSQLGEVQSKDFVNSLSTDSPISIRHNPLKPPLKPQNSLPISWCSGGYYLLERPSFTLDPAFHAGAYYVQEASSMFLEQAILHAVDLRQPVRALDLCAAPGGKSTHLLSLLSPESLLVSNEVILSRANILAENILKWGNTNTIVTSSDPESFSELAGYFDLIVVDAPCSGEGLFRKEPKAMQEWSPANVELCSQRQRRILSDAFPALKQNGILIYSTCTYNRRENEENLKWLTVNNQVEFIRIPVKPKWGIEEVDEDGIIGYRFYPHRVKGEGFFLSVMRKTASADGTIFRSKEKTKPLKEVGKVHDWLQRPDLFHYFPRPEGIRILPEQYALDLEGLAKHLFIVQAGTFLGSFKHEKFIPDHALGLSNHLNKNQVSKIPVELTDALQFLRKETLALPDAPMGYSLLTYNGLGLGWINGLGNRVNNLYPTHWRIRMK